VATTIARDPQPVFVPLRQALPPPFKRESTVYAITFDLDVESLRIHYGDPYNNAYLEIRRVMERHHFQWQQGSVYFGGKQVTTGSVLDVLVDLVSLFPWFSECVRDVRVLRIEENNDLLPNVKRLAKALYATGQDDD